MLVVQIASATERLEVLDSQQAPSYFLLVAMPIHLQDPCSGVWFSRQLIIERYLTHLQVHQKVELTASAPIPATCSSAAEVL